MAVKMRLFVILTSSIALSANVIYSTSKRLSQPKISLDISNESSYNKYMDSKSSPYLKSKLLLGPKTQFCDPGYNESNCLKEIP